MNEYLQIHVMGEPLHSITQTDDGSDLCQCGSLCDVFSGEDLYLKFYYSHQNKDYSDPTHYEALRKQLVKLGEWTPFKDWCTDKWFNDEEHTTFPCGEMDEWENLDLSDRIPLIHEYALSRGAEYWKEKRG